MPEKNAVDEFMLKEYESIASAHFDSQTGLRQQFRFYLLIAAVPLTVLGLAFKDRPASEIEQIGIFNLPHLLSSVFFGIGFLGLLMLLSMVHTALDATLYARTVNGVRHYFVDRGAALTVDCRQYLKMPTRQDRPHYFRVKAFFWQVVLIAAINSFYLTVGIHSFWKWPCLSVGLFVGIFSTQVVTFWYFCRQRERQEISGP
jgi:hypothetical protein